MIATVFICSCHIVEVVEIATCLSVAMATCRHVALKKGMAEKRMEFGWVEGVSGRIEEWRRAFVRGWATRVAMARCRYVAMSTCWRRREAAKRCGWLRFSLGFDGSGRMRFV
jgi:hypothetical protein